MSTVIKYITSGGLYVVFGLWSFFQVLEYKYYTRVEQYDSIVENMRICKQKYGELLLKMRQLEDAHASLQLPKVSCLIWDQVGIGCLKSLRISIKNSDILQVIFTN